MYYWILLASDLTQARTEINVYAKLGENPSTMPVTIERLVHGNEI